jgi:predicted ATPase/DNA-binding XRE family transcriptional regulator
LVTPSASRFGDLLREFRVRAGFSQSDLAEKANISEAAVGALERGVRKAPHRSTAALLAKALTLTAQESDALESARVAARKTSVESFAHNIEPERTSFVGRGADVAQIRKLLQRSRLVTVTGSGGVGKTRAALEVARHVLGDPWDEVWFVDLSPLLDGGSIAAKIASTIEPRLTERADSIASLASAMERRRMVLIFDNCEHLIESAAEAADLILERCPHISILATSRERLNVAGEFVYRLPSLSPEAASDLFVQRAQAADQSSSFDAAQLRSVTDIAQRLGGIPLAIELIAVQVPVLGLETLRARLHEEFKVPSGRRDLPERQQTVIATIQWSYRLLTAGEQTLLAGVSIFSGGFTIGAAEAVCGGDMLDGSQVVPLLFSLTNKSLISVDNTGGAVRYSLLESLRAFGLERLGETGAYEELARRHARWLADIAIEIEATSAYLSGDRAAELLPELDNVRAAVAWSLGAREEDDRVYAAQILTGLAGLWDRVGRRHEHRRLVEAALERIDEERYPRAVSDLLRDQVIRTWQEPRVLDLIDHALAVSEKSGDPLAPAKLLVVAAQALCAHHMLDRAEACVERSSEILRANGMQGSMLYAPVFFARSNIRMAQGRIDDARRDLEASEKIAQAHGDRYYIACFIYLMRAEIEYAAGDKRLALQYVERLMEGEFASDGHAAMLGLGRMVNLRLQLGDVEGAVEPLRDWLKRMRGNEDYTRAEFEYTALALALRHSPIVAARLLGRVRALEAVAPFSRSNMRRDAYELLCSSLQQQLDDDAIAAAGADGARLAGDEAIDEAMAALV